MAKKSKMVTTSEFSKLSGITVSTLNKWIRDKKIKAEKQSGRWMIGEDQLTSKAVRQFGGAKPVTAAAGGKKKSSKPAKKPASAARQPLKAAKPKKTPKKPSAGAKTYSVDEFSAMTYLTDFGVREFLKKGRLKGEIDEGGNWKVSAENLLDPLIKHLVR
ncbi:MAG: hypothetical protein AMJ54_09855 [Deltaproteobacteria bacterium SG8_13]|nr:MAG: hypothetical protein AMJ54_09855 [Deltaproteobacteria bacterium SG8_13]